MQRNSILLFVDAPFSDAAAVWNYAVSSTLVWRLRGSAGGLQSSSVRRKSRSEDEAVGGAHNVHLSDRL
jgi:hypothetical protein